MQRKYLETTSCISLVLAAGLLMGTSHSALANPDGGVVSAGSATITSPSAGKVDINQTSNNVVIDWRSFDIAPNEHTQFYQPSANSTALNRVNSPNASQIMGKLSANGNVIIVNQSGIVFGKDSVVDVNGLVATTSDITNTNLMNGNLLFDKAGNPNAAVVNKGTITAKDAGLVGLVAPRVTNSGTITAKLGKAQLASGDKFSVDLYGDGLMNITLSDAVTTQLVENSGTVKAEGGTIELTAAAGANVVNSLVNVSGELLAPSISNKDGKITISAAGSSLSHTGTIDVSSNIAGTKAGTINVTANKIANQGKMTADSTSTGAAGSINIAFQKSYIDNQTTKVSAKGTTTAGGKVTVTGGHKSTAFISGNYDVSSTGNKGGTATITTDAGDLNLFGAHVTANGKTGGGTINIGGEYQGSGTTVHSSKTGINYATYLSANATDTGNGGNVIVWSDDLTQFAGHAFAKGGTTSGNGGLIELSSKDTLQVTSNADTNASATNGAAGHLLLDPKNIIVATGGITGGISYFEFIDPNPDVGGDFGKDNVIGTTNGNWIITDKNDDTMATDAGAIYLFNGATGGLISSLYGASANDQIGFELGGSSYPSLLSNGNYVLFSTQWDDGSVQDVGAITFFNSTTGLSGVVGVSNSLIGSNTGDFDGSYLQELTNGNAVINNTLWDNGSVQDAGAVTFISGTTLTTGIVDASNSLVGTTQGDFSSASYIIPLTNGNYVVMNGLWDNGSAVDAGAVTWGSGTTGVSGIIDNTNSYVGTSSNDFIGGFGSAGIAVLANGNYVLQSFTWNNGAATYAGAVTWGNGTTGSVGDISALNSLVGTRTNDRVGNDFIEVLPNGNWITSSVRWANGTNSNAGFVYIGDANTATSGTISAANAVVGTSAGDRIQVLQKLANGKIVVGSESWDNGSVQNVGAVRVIDPTHASATGAISATNSLVGSQTDDFVGIYPFRFIELGNGAFVVGSFEWNNGGLQNAGAVTWIDSNAPTVGAVSPSNSFVGTKANDEVGEYLFALSNGNYVIGSPKWDNGGVQNVGAATWANGSSVLTGTVTTSNSLYGGTANDQIGGDYKIGEMGTSGNYYISSSTWNYGGIIDAGALIWGNGATGSSGLVSPSNAIVGGATDDFLEPPFFVCATSTMCAAKIYGWDNGSAVDAGAILFLSVNGFSGVINNTTALVGTQTDDHIGTDIIATANGNYLIHSSDWSNGGAAYAGAVTWVNGTTGLTGDVSATNSIVGTSVGDAFGQSLYEINNNTYILTSRNFNNGSVVDAGAITVISTTGPTTGYINATNSLVGAVTGDISGNFTMLTATTGFMINTSYDHGSDVDAGAITYFDLAGGLTGYLDESNSLFGGANSGMTYDPYSDYTHYDSTNNRYVIALGNEQRVISFVFGSSLSDYDSYADSAAATITLDPTFITNVLNGGTSVTLQASNDITINDAIITSGGGTGGALTLQAGRSIFINDDIFTDNGNLNIFGNEKLATGVINAHRDAGNAVITMANGTSLDAGTGDVVIRLDDGAGKTNRGAGDITLQTVNGNTITAINNNTSGDVVLSSGASLNASATSGTSILLASKRNFINNAGASVLNTLGSARWLSYSTNSTTDTLGGLSSAFTLFNCTYGGSCGTLGAGNGFLYSFNNSTTPPTTGSGNKPVPPTVLYVSQTPPPNIINTPPSSGTQTSSKDGEETLDYLATEPQNVAENKAYSLFNGWVIIDPALVKKLNLFWSKI